MDIDMLPKYLVTSIREYEENKDNPLRWDIYADDLYGSINSAQHDGDITKQEADELRRIYLGMRPDNILDCSIGIMETGDFSRIT